MEETLWYTLYFIMITNCVGLKASMEWCAHLSTSTEYLFYHF